MNISTREYVNYYRDLWNETSSGMTQFDTVYSRKQQKENSAAIATLIKDIIEIITENINEHNSDDKIKNQSIQLIKAFLLENINLSNETVEFMINEGYVEVIEEFIDKVKLFNENMSLEDIFQALSNVLVMNTIQLMLGKPVELTPAVFGYSMLYPYLDNYIDDSSISNDYKKEFNKKIRNWIEGNEVEWVSDYEKKVVHLLEKIESVYNRKDYPMVYDSLLLIQKAQEKGIKVQNGMTIPYEKGIIDISFEKGGTSVVADGYLVNADISEVDVKFIFGYGAFLQLLDDCEDALADQKEGSMTIFSQLIGHYKLDIIANKLFNFKEKVLKEYSRETTEKILILQELISYFSTFMIMNSIIKNKRWYSRSYIKNIKKHYYLNQKYNWKDRISKNIKCLNKSIIETIIDKDEAKFTTNIIWLLKKL